MSDPTTPVGATAPPPERELPALKQIRESAQALLREGKTDETLQFLLSALEAVLVKTHELELLVGKLRPAALPRS